jgi:hypothetical protein
VMSDTPYDTDPAAWRAPVIASRPRNVAHPPC